jgi:hypothetical protein
MAEEEREGLTDFRRLAGLQRRHDLAVAFAAYEARNYAGVPAVDKDPEAYVRGVEEELPSPPSESPSTGSPSAGSASTGSASTGSASTGSLSIGSLKRG